MPGQHNAKEDTTALTTLAIKALADGRLPAATANAAATLDRAFGLALGLAFAEESWTKGHGSLLHVPLG